MIIHPNRPLTRREASAYLWDRRGIKRSPGTLAKLAVIGGGPQFRKAGRAVIYEAVDLDAFADEITSAPVRSTSELTRSPIASNF